MINLSKTHLTPTQHESAIEWFATAFEGRRTDHLGVEQSVKIIEAWYDGGLDQFKIDVAHCPF